MTFVILIAASLIGVIFVMSDNANAAVAASGAVIARPGIDESGLAVRPGFAANRPNVFNRPNAFDRPFIRPFFRPFFNPFIFDEEEFFFGFEEGFAED
jgi:hypothetical protein